MLDQPPPSKPSMDPAERWLLLLISSLAVVGIGALFYAMLLVI